MPKNEPGSPMYAVAERCVDVALRPDDSLFTPGRSIWSLPNLDELDQLYVQRPDLGGDSFEEKLQKQLDGGSADAYQLMAEVMFVFYLPARWNISAQTKRQRIEEVLSWSPDPVTLPSDLSDVLEHGVGSGGQGMLMYKWASLVFLLSFARRWKQATAEIRQIALADPWKFREFVAQIPTDGGGIYGRESLLHLVFPDTFERIFSGRDKWRLTEQMKQLVDDPDANVDLKISQVRAKLGARFGSSFDFYDTDGVRALWKPMDSKLDEFIYWASKFHELGRFDAEERDYKLETTSRLTAARDALMADADWLPLLRRAFAIRSTPGPHDCDRITAPGPSGSSQTCAVSSPARPSNRVHTLSGTSRSCGEIETVRLSQSGRRVRAPAEETSYGSWPPHRWRHEALPLPRPSLSHVRGSAGSSRSSAVVKTSARRAIAARSPESFAAASVPSPKRSWRTSAVSSRPRSSGAASATAWGSLTNR